MIFEENGLIGVRLDSGRLITGRPDAAGLLVAQINIFSPAVARQVFAPSRDGDVAPAAVARARRREHHGVAPIRKQLRSRRRVVRGAEAANHRRDEFAHFRAARKLLRREAGRPARRAACAPAATIRWRARSVRRENGCASRRHLRRQQSHQRHGLMVGHVSAKRPLRPFPPAGGWACSRALHRNHRHPAAGLRDAREILQGRHRFDHRSERRGIRRDHQIFAEAAFESQSRNAETRY